MLETEVDCVVLVRLVGMNWRCPIAGAVRVSLDEGLKSADLGIALMCGRRGWGDDKLSRTGFDCFHNLFMILY